jgi:hypothetical protein
MNVFREAFVSRVGVAVVRWTQDQDIRVRIPTLARLPTYNILWQNFYSKIDRCSSLLSLLSLLS